MLTCPAVVFSLGLFIFVINGVMLLITDSLAGDRLIIEGGIITAILGGMVMAGVSIALETVLRLDGTRDGAAKVTVIKSDPPKRQ